MDEWFCAVPMCLNWAILATAVNDENGEALCPEHGEEFLRGN